MPTRYLSKKACKELDRLRSVYISQKKIDEDVSHMVTDSVIILELIKTARV